MGRRWETKLIFDLQVIEYVADLLVSPHHRNLRHPKIVHVVTNLISGVISSLKIGRSRAPVEGLDWNRCDFESYLFIIARRMERQGKLRRVYLMEYGNCSSGTHEKVEKIGEIKEMTFPTEDRLHLREKRVLFAIFFSIDYILSASCTLLHRWHMYFLPSS